MKEKPQENLFSSPEPSQKTYLKKSGIIYTEQINNNADMSFLTKKNSFFILNILYVPLCDVKAKL